MVITIFTVAFIVFLLLGVPVVFALGCTALLSGVAIWGLEGLPLDILAQRMISGLDTFTMLGIPLFLLAGRLMNAGTISDRIFSFAQSLVGHYPGGLGYVNVIASVIFSGMSGSAAADAAGLGQLEIRAMTKQGYDADFSAGVTGASALISPIIPPSVPMLTYGILAGCSVTRMFIGGILPGLMMAGGMCGLVAYYAKKRNYPRCSRTTWREFVVNLKEAFLPLLTPIIIIGGIWTGFFTPTEAAGVVVFYALVLIIFVYRCMNLPQLWDELKKAMIDCSCVLFVMAGVNLYGYVLTRTRIPVYLANWIVTLTDDSLLIIIALNVFLLVIGCFMSALEAIMLFTPIFIPILNAYGYDPVVFGVMMCVNLMVGQLTPPFGTTLFILSKIADLSMDRVVKACFPFIIPVLGTVALIVFFPGIVTFLPNLVYGK